MVILHNLDSLTWDTQTICSKPKSELPLIPQKGSYTMFCSEQISHNVVTEPLQACLSRKVSDMYGRILGERRDLILRFSTVVPFQ